MDSPEEKKQLLSRIGLGTAQFGLIYGITNRRGKLRPQEVAAILKCAREAGISFLDTAPAYGTSEKLLGSLSEALHFSIGTKTPVSLSSPEDVLRGLEHSLKKLSRSSVDVLLVHHSDVLRREDGDAYWQALQRCKAEGLVRKIGISLYDVPETMELLERFSPEVVQIPLNPLDQRFLRQGVIRSLYQKDIEIHVRSAFLQGTLLTPLEELPSSLPQEPFLRWQHFCRHYSWSLLEASLGFILGIPEISKVICGITSEEELRYLFHSAVSLETSLFNPCHEENQFARDPRMWN